MDDRFSPEVQRALLDMFASDGWRFFIEDVNENLNGVNTLDGISSEQTLGYRQGQVNTLRSVIAYEDTIRNAVDTNTAEAADPHTITLDG